MSFFLKCLERAILVIQSRDVDLGEIRRWSAALGYRPLHSYVLLTLGSDRYFSSIILRVRSNPGPVKR